MYSCELFSVRKNKTDSDALERDFDKITSSLSARSVEVRYKTNVAADPKKLDAAVGTTLSDGSANILLFANALNSADSSSFKKLFYEVVATLEAKSPDGGKIRIFSLGDLGGGYPGYCFKHNGKVFIAAPCFSCAGGDPAELLTNAVVKASEALSSGSEKSAQKEETEPAPKRKEGFFASFFPHKGDSRGNIVRKIIVLIAIAAFIGAGAYVLKTLVFDEIQQDKITAEIQNLAYNRTSETTEDGEVLPEQDWDALKKVNKEIVGWIRIDNTPINYPVLYHKEDDQYSQYYLKHTYKGDYSDYGSIFVDYRCVDSVNSKNVILHGHNMLNGSMFHELVNYSNRFEPKLDYYKKHSVITFNTPEGDSKWKIISVFKTSTLYEHGEFFNYMQAEFNSDAEFMNFVYNVRIRSMFNIPVSVNENDRILTLSTCSYEFTNFRTVVVARQVRPDEDDSVDVKLATVNSSPLYPDVYYRSYGGTRPDPLTFKTADAKGMVSWYDGEGNLEGSEDLTATLAANPTESPTTKNGTPINPTYYQVIYRNVDDTQIEAHAVREGDPVPIPDIIPTYEDDYYTYNFVKWDFDVPGVDFNALNTSVTIYPIYNAVPKNNP